MRTRFPRSVFGVGEEPDPRFTLANERTFLAWNRTALAFIAGGVALAIVDLNLHPALRLIASLGLIAIGATLPAVAWIEWTKTERALRLSLPLPGSVISFALMVVIIGIAVVLILSVVLR